MNYVHIDGKKHITDIHTTLSGLCEYHQISLSTVRAGLKRYNGWYVRRSGQIICIAERYSNPKMIRKEGLLK